MYSLFIRFTLFCLCFPLFLIAYENFEPDSSAPPSQSLASTEGLPSNLVNHCVCTITGEYIDSQTDIILPGPEPLVIQRNYSSQQRHGNFGGYWCLNHLSSIITGSQHEGPKRTLGLLLTQPTSARILYTYCTFDEKLFGKEEKVLFKPQYPKGLTNGARGQIGGGTNIKNQKVYFYPKSEKIEVILGSGDTRTFKKFARDKASGHYVCFPMSEDKRNGNAITYEYEDYGFWKKIQSVNRHTKLQYNWIKCEKHPKYTEDHPIFEFKTSQNKSVTYHFSRYKYKQNKQKYFAHHLEKIECSDRPSQSYEYGKASDFVHHHIKSKQLPDDRFLKISYYSPGNNPVGPLGQIQLSNEDYRLDRVRMLQAPVGTDPTPITTHYFLYQANEKKHKDGSKEILDGQTEVFNASLHKIVYSYDKEHQLRKKMRFRGVFPHYSLYNSEGYVWGSKDSDQEGNLLGKYLKDESGNIHSIRYFTYDSAGNLETDSLCGSLTGKECPSISLNAHGHPIKHGYEVYKKKYTYSTDGLNLLLSEEEPNGKKILYDYHPQTGLLRFKLVVYQDKVHIRTAYEYNENGVLTSVITDNGSSIRPKNKEGVTEKKITRIIPKKTPPFNLPEQIEELCFNFNTGKEQLIKRVIYHYYRDGHLKRQDHHDSEGIYRYSLNWEYDAHGNVTKETNALGETITYLYDANDNKIFQEGPLPNHRIHYTYDYANRLIEQKEIHPNGKSFVTSHRYDYLGNKIATVDHQGHETTYHYDELGRLIKTEYPLLLQEEGTLLRPVTSKQYDVAGFVCCEEDALGNKIQRKNNIRGQPVHISYPDGTEERFFYELNGSLAQKIEKNGTTVRYTRDFLDRVVLQEIIGSDGKVLKTVCSVFDSFHLKVSTDAEGLQTQYFYDFAGRLTSLIKADQYITQTYDSLGRVSEIREWYGSEESQVRINKKEYDLLNRVIEERIETKDGEVLSLARYEYDVHGNQVIKQKGEVKKRTFYDANKRPIKIIDALGYETHIVYKHRHKNCAGQRVLKKIETDSLGNQTIEIYNTKGSVAEVIRQNAAGLILSHVKIWYDLNGNKKQTEELVYIEGKYTRQIQHKWHYNAMNQLITLIEAANTPEQKVTHYHYNQYGQQDCIVKPNGMEILSRYNAGGLLCNYKASDGSIHYQYEYNKGDLPTKVVDLTNGLVTQRSYDSMGQIKTEKLGNGFVVNYAYDRVGRIKSFELPDQSRIDYKYDAAHLKRIERIQNDQITYAYCALRHNLAGAVLASRGISHQEYSYDYDALGRLIDNKLPNFQQSIPENGYDAVGNLVCYQDSLPNCENCLEHHFSYDGLYQLTAESGYEGHTYTYDSVCGRVKKDNMACTVNALNQIMHQGLEKFTYTPNGNLRSRLFPNGEFVTYEYDALDRLVKVIKGTDQIHYVYDSFNRRIMIRQNGKKDKLFIYQGQHEIGVVEDVQIKQLKVIHPGEIGKSVAIELEGMVYEPVHDLFGHTVRLLNIDGQIVEQYQYTAFGEEVLQDPDGNVIPCEQIINPWRYADKRVDEFTGFIAFGLRYYNSGTGSWVTADPLGYEDGPNLYAYVHANPLIYYDALGLFSMPFKSINDSDIYSHPNAELPMGFLGICDFRRGIFNGSDFSHFKENGGNYNLNDDFVDPKSGNPFQLKESRNHRINLATGIDNSSKDVGNSLVHLSKFTQGFNVYATHSPTRDILRDLYRYFATTFFDIGFQGVHHLHEIWHDFFSKADSDATFLQVCHSWGAATVRNALRCFPEELRKRISVIGIAPGAYISRDLCKDVIHYVCWQDIVPALDVSGKKMARTEGSIKYLGDPNSWFSLWNSNHSFTSEIYELGLQFDIDRYLKGLSFRN